MAFSVTHTSLVRDRMTLARSLIAAAAMIALSSAPVSAHDFWVQPAAFHASAGSPVPITFQVGHGADRQRWGGGMQRVVSLRAIGPGGVVTDRRSRLRLGQIDDGVLTFASGTHVIAFETNNAASTLPADKFNAYLTGEGLTPAIQRRRETNTTDAAGRELYSRRAKAVVCVGPADGRDEHVTGPVGQTLEIAPERNPCTLPAGEALPVRVYYAGRPLAGALVKLTNLDFDARTLEQNLTDANGRATFRVPRTGSWLLNVVWTRPLDAHASADFETVFSSLTFGFGPPAPANLGR